MSHWKFAASNNRFATLFRVAKRNYAAMIVKHPPELKKIQEPEGFMWYSRNVSRNKRYDPSVVPQHGDTPFRFLTRRLGHAYELYPLVCLISFWVCIAVYATYYSFEKMEVWLDRSQEDPPWAWERIRDNYWKRPTLLFDSGDVSHRRLEVLEELEDEMLEAARKRGTRK